MSEFVKTVRLLGLLLPQLAPCGHSACIGELAFIGNMTWTPGFYGAANQIAWIGLSVV